MSSKVQQSVCSDCVTYAKSRIDFNYFNTFNNVSKECRERIQARMKEVSECVANCGVSADRLAQRLREFAEAGRRRMRPSEKTR